MMLRGGTRLLLATASFAVAGCSAGSHNIQVRAIPDPATKLRQGGDQLAQAQGQLALGNVGLALEGFRKAARESSGSPEAFAGIAACYASMGRYDLARSNYEAALALAPHDPGVMSALAGTFDHLGMKSEAVELRAELVRAPNPVLPSALTEAGVDAVSDAKIARDTAIEPRPIARVETSVTVAPPAAATPPRNGLSEAPAAKVSSITVMLPPARPAEQLSRQSSALPSDAVQRTKPRLERLSFGEVALVTAGTPIWRAQVVSRTRLSTTVRWIPIQSANARPNIQIFNAARQKGLASRARGILVDRGWRKIEIGDASQVREKSVVLYPAARGTLGRRLAAQFGIRSLMVGEGDVLRVLLGRDAASLAARQRRG